VNFGFDAKRVEHQLELMKGIIDKPVFAVDVGGVLASKQHDGFPIEGAVSALATLSKHYMLWVVSQCGRNRALQTEEWLRDHKMEMFFHPEHRIYVSFKENKTEPLRTLKAEYFVDDRMKHCVPAQNVDSIDTIFLFGKQDEWTPYKTGKIINVETWWDLIARLGRQREAALRGAWEDGECPQQEEKT
jgi:hypothetical protein